MGEDDIVELLWKSGRVVQSSQTQRPSSDPPTILRGSGSGGGEEEENAPLPPPPPLPPLHHQNLFIQEDEMYSWLHQSYRQDYLCSELRYSGVASNPATHPQSSISPAPCPFAPYDQRGQTIATRRVENFMNFSWLRGNIFTGGRVEAGVVRESIQLGSSTTPSSSATESCVIPATEGTESRVSQTLAVPGLGQKGKAVVIETAETPSSGVCKAETEPVQIQPATIVEIQGTEEARGSTSRKRSRTAEMHNLAERRRREKINKNIKTLQELIPRCNKSTKVSTLDDAIEYVKWLQSQIQMMSTGQGMMPPMMYAGNTQQFMPHIAMDMNRPPPFIPFPDTPFPRPAQMADVGPSYPAPRYPFSGIQTFDPSRVHLRSPQPNPVSNQPQFPAYMNPYSQFAGLRQLQQPPPPPFQSQTTSQMSFGQTSCTKEPEDQDNQPTGCKVVRGICASTTASRLRFLDAVPLLVSI